MSNEHLQEAIDLYGGLITRDCGETVHSIVEKVQALLPSLNMECWVELMQVKTVNVAKIVGCVIGAKFPYLRVRHELKHPTWLSVVTGNDIYFSISVLFDSWFNFHSREVEKRGEVQPDEMALIEKLAGVTAAALRGEIASFINRATPAQRANGGFRWKRMPRDTYERYRELCFLLFKHVRLEIDEKVVEPSSSVLSLFKKKDVEEGEDEDCVDVFIVFTMHTWY